MIIKSPGGPIAWKSEDFRADGSLWGSFLFAAGAVVNQTRRGEENFVV